MNANNDNPAPKSTRNDERREAFDRIKLSLKDNPVAVEKLEQLFEVLTRDTKSSGSD